MGYQRARALLAKQRQQTADREYRRMLRALKKGEIGGGQVMQTFTLGDRRVFAGTVLDAETIDAMPTNNRNALIEKNMLFVWPKSVVVPIASAGAAAATSSSGRGGQTSAAPALPSRVAGAAPIERHVCHLGLGRYDVIEGRKLNAEPIADREEAYRLAGKPVPVSVKVKKSA